MTITNTAIRAPIADKIAMDIPANDFIFTVLLCNI